MTITTTAPSSVIAAASNPPDPAFVSPRCDGEAAVGHEEDNDNTARPEYNKDADADEAIAEDENGWQEYKREENVVVTHKLLLVLRFGFPNSRLGTGKA